MVHKNKKIFLTILMDTDERRICYMFLRKLISVEYFAAEKHSHIFTLKSYAVAVHIGRITEKCI